MPKDMLLEELVKAHIKEWYFNKPCPHCGKMFTDNDITNLTVSVGGQYVTPEEGEIIAAHSTCYYKFEASEEWRQMHSDLKDK